MSTVIQIGPHWDYQKVRKFFIFGDSYSAVGQDASLTRGSTILPCAREPLGTRFPGLTWNEPDLPNWVGHFLLSFCNQPRFPFPIDKPDPTTYKEASDASGWTSNPFLIYDYAVGGAMALDVERQIHQFITHIGHSPSWVNWGVDETLFITEVGINDCAYATTHNASFSILREQHERLYQAGVRNFMFMDVPPINMTPAVRPTMSDRTRDACENWNTSLDQLMKSFAEAHPDATVLLFGLSRLFTTFLKEPDIYGFPPMEVRRRAGQIWYDHLHPTSKVHEIIAGGLADFLSDVQPMAPPVPG